MDSGVHTQQNFTPLVKSESYFLFELSEESAPACTVLQHTGKENIYQNRKCTMSVQ